ncbi:uncharacterized protein LOC119306673 [Triticum dicoccoides]|uniref:uncharacterized protein LOC119306673 n=1 Tax=Triticum dicoccoides TaxID=85692 RepID=UPI000E7BA6ED|nr:uncharacterized protein LOC119306673 [Triticum dicoccoides]
MPIYMSMGSFGQLYLDGGLENVVQPARGGQHDLGAGVQAVDNMGFVHLGKRKERDVEETNEVIFYQGKPVRELNLLAGFANEADGRKIVTSTENGVSPFRIPEFNYEFVSPMVAHAAWIKIQQLSQDVMNRVWVDAQGPPHVKMTGYEIYENFCQTMNDKGFEVANMMMREQDGRWYAPSDRARFHHPMPPYFASRIMEGGNSFLSDPLIKNLFVGEHLGYDVETCRLITVSLKGEGGFHVLYVFDMLKKIAHVMDPKRTQWNLLELERKHAQVMDRMIYGLCKCIDKFFKGWHVREDEFIRKAHRELHAPPNSFDSPFYTLHYTTCFDGELMTEGMWADKMLRFKQKLMMLVLTMPANNALPAGTVINPRV